MGSRQKKDARIVSESIRKAAVRVNWYEGMREVPIVAARVTVTATSSVKTRPQ